MGPFYEQYSGELMMLILGAMLFGTLLLLVPQLLRAQHHSYQLKHEQFLRALEQGQPLPLVDDRSRYAGRTAALVPMVVFCAAGTVTCFLAGFKSENLFAVSLAVWSVAGVVSLAAITGGIALMGRLAQIHAGQDDEDELAEERLGIRHED